MVPKNGKSFHTMEIEDRPWWLCPANTYMHFLACTIYFIHSYKKTWYVFLGFTSLALIGFAVYGALHLVEKPRDLHTFKKMVNDPFVPFLLLVAAHLTLAMFAEKMYTVYGRIRDGKPDHKAYGPPSPILFPFFCGKAFMLLRLILAYHSGDLGVCIDYFCYQELILIALHVLIACVVLPHFGDNPRNGRSMNLMLFLIIGMDAFKTVFMFFFWLVYEPGAIMHVFNRLPDSTTQIAATLCIHGFLDILQNLASVFTIWIARASAALFLCGNEPGCVVDPSPEDYNWFTKLNLFWLDSYWCELLFIESKWFNNRTASDNCKADMDDICGEKLTGYKPLAGADTAL